MARTDNLNNFLTDIADAIREKTGSSDAIDASAFDTAIENIPSGGGSSGVYRVETTQERDALTDVNEGDICVIVEKVYENWQTTTNTNMIFFPEEVTLPFAQSWSTTTTLTGTSFTANLSIGQLSCSVNSEGSIYINISYSSNDGMNYTRQNFVAENTSTGESLINGNIVTLPMSVSMESSQYLFGYFLQVESGIFNGLYAYTNNSWGYLDIGTDIEALDALAGKKAYTNNGFITGTFGTTINDTLLKTRYNNICNCVNNYKPTATSSLFLDCLETSLAVTKLIDTSSATNFSHMFQRCTRLTDLDLSNFDTSNATDMSYMFQFSHELTDLDLSNFDTSNVTDMSWMFCDCKSLVNLDLSSFDTSNVTSMYNMFNSCTALINLDLSNFNTNRVTDFRQTFRYCKALTTLDIRNFDFTNVSTYTEMFGLDASTGPADNCLIIVKDNTAKTWITSKFSRLTNVQTVAEYEASLNS